MASNANELCAFATQCGKNVSVNGSLVKWQSTDSGGRLFIDKPLRSNDNLALTFTGNGHAEVGILTKNPTTLPNVHNIENLKELTVIQVARIYKQTGIIKINRCPDGDKIITESGDGTHTHNFNKADKIWITLNIIFGTLKVKIDPPNFGFYAKRGENIAIENNEALLKYPNPSAVCYLKEPLRRGETISLKIDPNIKDGKPSRNFSVKMAMSEMSPAEFLPGKSEYYDIETLPLLPVGNVPRKIQKEVKIELTHGGVIRIHCEKGTFTGGEVTFKESFIIFETCRVTLKCTNRMSQSEMSSDVLTEQHIEDANVSDSIYNKSKIELKLIREDAESISESIISNENNISVEPNTLPTNKTDQNEREVDALSLESLHRKVDGLSGRLLSVEHRINTNMTKSEDKTIRNSEICELQKDVDEIKRMLERLTIESDKRNNSGETGGKNHPVEGKTFLEFVQQNYTYIVDTLDTVALLDYLFEKDKISLAECERLRKQSHSNRPEANRDTLDLLMKRENVDMKAFIKMLKDTKQDGIVSKMT